MTPPRTRGDRVNGPRPCPWARCRWHLADATSESCALDVADRGGCTLKGVGYVLHLTRERVRQIEAKAIRKLQHPIRARKLEGFREHATK